MDEMIVTTAGLTLPAASTTWSFRPENAVTGELCEPPDCGEPALADWAWSLATTVTDFWSNAPAAASAPTVPPAVRAAALIATTARPATPHRFGADGADGADGAVGAGPQASVAAAAGVDGASWGFAADVWDSGAGVGASACHTTGFWVSGSIGIVISSGHGRTPFSSGPALPDSGPSLNVP